MKKLVLDERVKHRLTGVLVIVSIAVIFLPAMIKRSNQHLSERVNVSVKLPPKPLLPKVAMVEEKAVFSDIKVAKVDIPSVETSSSVKPISVGVQAPLKSPLVTPKLVEPAAQASTRVAFSRKLASNLKASLPMQRKVVSQKEAYVVQLAAFNQEENAVALVSRLRNKGYAARYSKQGAMYKVVVSSLGNRNNARVLQKKIADTMQMNGLIVRAEVS